jgi:hypothetical protein
MKNINYNFTELHHAIHGYYRLSASISHNRHERLIYVKNQFMNNYGHAYINRYFSGSMKSFWMWLSDEVSIFERP